MGLGRCLEVDSIDWKIGWTLNNVVGVLRVTVTARISLVSQSLGLVLRSNALHGQPSDRFVSSDLNKRIGHGSEPVEISHHKQSGDAVKTISKLKEIARRSRPGEEGFDALGIVVIDFANDGRSATVVEDPPAPSAGNLYSYSSVMTIAHEFDARCSHI